MIELSPELLFVLSLSASVFVFLLKLIFVDRGHPVPTWVYNVALAAVSLIFATAFTPVILPPFPSNDGSLLGLLAAFLSYVGLLLPILAAIVGFSKIIYETLLKKVLEGLASAVREHGRLIEDEDDGSDIG